MDHCSCESQAALNLLKTARGQIDGIVRMIDADAYCVDVSQQIASVLAILRKANLKILRQHMQTCVAEAMTQDEETSEKKLAEITGILEKYLGG